VLEQLLNSQSLAGTVTWLIELRHVHAIGSVLILMWALSPLGGQSALRLLSVEDVAVKTMQQVSYASLNASTGYLWGESPSASEVYVPAMISYYSAALLGAEGNKQESTDIWGNPKIPVFDSLRGNDRNWRQVNGSETTQYASLTGVRLQGLCRDCELAMSVETSYSTLDCRNVAHRVRFSDILNYTGPDIRGWDPEQWTEPFLGTAYRSAQEPWTSSFIVTTRYMPPSINDTAWIVFVARNAFTLPNETFLNTNTASIYNCSLETHRVEAEVVCKGGSCGVHRVRPSLVDTRPRRWSFYHEGALGFEYLCRYFPFASGYARFQVPTATDRFLFGDAAPFNTTPNGFPDWTLVADTTLSYRLTMVLNTMHHTDIAPISISTGDTFQPLRCVNTPETVGKPIPLDPCDFINFTMADVSRNTKIYRTSKVWVTLLLLTSIFMLLLGAASITLQCINTVPDILGYVSTITRDNPYVELPANASVVDGPERTRLLRDLRIQLTDVQPGADVGHLAVCSVA
jgi:hypothetical protein